MGKAARKNRNETRDASGHIPALDGLRAVGVLAAILYHAKMPGFYSGYLGVDVFFVLSGYMITTLMLRELADSGRVRLWHFYLRRILRLYPALLLMLVMYCGAMAVYTPPELAGQQYARDSWISVFYLTDYMRAFDRMDSESALGHTWSLAVEEHYYILWPFLLIWLRRMLPAKKLAPALAGLYLAAVGWKMLCLYMGQPWSSVYPRFDTRMTGLLLGGALAAWIFHGGKAPVDSMSALLAGIVFADIMPSFPTGTLNGLAVGVTLAEWCSLLAILVVLMKPAGIAARALSLPPVAFIGRISYGMYLFHYPVAIFFRDRFSPIPAALIIVAATMALAVFSYYTVELLARRIVAAKRLRHARA